MSNSVVKILWTGGWDSTYRLVELSRTDAEIQPVYLTGDGRISKDFEMKAMDNILNLLAKKSETTAKILPLEIVDINELPENPKITEAFQRIFNANSIGTQYEFIAKYAIDNPGVEICAEKPDGEYSGIVNVCEANGGFVPYGDNSWCLNKEVASQDCKLVFGNLSFPIVTTTELQMKENIKRLGIYNDVMSSIWFCHTPIDGKPCGLCRPCEQKIEEGMSELLPKKALKKNKIVSFFKKHFGIFASRVVRKLLRMI